MIANTKLPFVRAYINNYNIEGKEINQFCIDFWDADGRTKDSHYRTFYCDELFFKSKKFDDEKTFIDLMGKMMDIEYKAQTIKKTSQDGFAYNIDRLILTSLTPTLNTSVKK